MKWKEILRKDGYALLQSESNTQYCVANDYDPTQSEDQQWNYGTYFTYWNDTKRKADCLQIGEPCSSRIDENGEGRTTYSTFKKVNDGIWEYCGDCFRGENYMHGKDIPYVR